MAGVRISSLLIPLYKTSITTHLEMFCLAVVTCTIVDSALIGFALISLCYQWNQGMNCIG